MPVARRAQGPELPVAPSTARDLAWSEGNPEIDQQPLHDGISSHDIAQHVVFGTDRQQFIEAKFDSG